MIIQGTAYWAKIVGEPQPGFDKSQKEWSLDLSVNDDTVAKLKAEGLGPKIKNKQDDRGNFISFKRKQIRADGSFAQPIPIKDAKGQDWDGKTLIGNGSLVNVMFLINDTEYKGKKFKKPGILKVQVVKLVEYEGGEREEFPEYDESGQEQWS
jgi:hypothetical protein